MKYYEDDFFYYFWKERGLACTLGNQKSFLDKFDDILNEKKLDKIYDIVLNQKKIFGVEGEYGLLNRLDNDTGGLLYFAKDRNIYKEYKDLQNQGKIDKIYIADVAGDFKYDETVISYPIMHHRHVPEIMVVVKNPSYLTKGRGKQHTLNTKIKKLSYDKEKNVSMLEMTINKGIRHQIRSHLASIGYPIIGDILYGKSLKADGLHLRSVGLKIE